MGLITCNKHLAGSSLVYVATDFLEHWWPQGPFCSVNFVPTELCTAEQFQLECWAKNFRILQLFKVSFITPKPWPSQSPLMHRISSDCMRHTSQLTTNTIHFIPSTSHLTHFRTLRDRKFSKMNPLCASYWVLCPSTSPTVGGCYYTYNSTMHGPGKGRHER